MDTATNKVKIKLLGSPNIVFHGKPLHFRSRKVLALFIYLLVTQETHSRDKLIDMFWMDSNRKRGRTSLRTTITRLRQSLAETAIIIQTEGDTISLAKTENIILDLNITETGLLTGETTNHHLPKGIFLEGFSIPDAPDFENWLSIQRSLWEQKVEKLYERVCRHQLDTGHRTQAIQTARHWIENTPHSEAAYQCLIEGYILTGSRTLALKTYEACHKMLHGEFGVRPSTKTEKLVTQSSIDNSIVREGENIAEANTSLSTLPFIGRTVEHQQIVAAFRRTLNNATHTVGIIGEAGIGKTRLVEDFLVWLSLQSTSVEVLTCRAFEMGGRLPYQPIIQAIRERIERENAPEDLLADVWLAELARVLPELLDRYPDLELPIVGDAELARSRLFEAIAMFGIQLASRQPIILFLDDLQWADEGTLDLLHYAIQRWQQANAPILFMTTIRQEALPNHPEITAWFNSLDIQGYFTSISLSILKPIDIIHLLQVLIQPSHIAFPTMQLEEFGQWLHHETQGSPFFLEAFLHLLVEEQVLQTANWNEAGELISTTLDINRALTYVRNERHFPLPPTIQSVMQNRLQKLGDAPNELLLAASVLGRDCTFTRICQISGIDELQGVSSLEELLQQRLLIEVRGKNPYRIVHDNVREIVYSKTSEARRRIYHRRAFMGLQSDHASAAELLFHAQAAQLRDEAFQYALIAGKDATLTFGYDEAIAHFDIAWKLIIDGEIDVDEKLLVDLCLNYGRALEANSDFGFANTFFEDVKQLATIKNSQQLQLIGIMGQATLRGLPTALQNGELAETLALQAIELSETLNDNAAKAKALWLLLLRFSFSRKHFDIAVQYGETSLEIAREHNLREQLAYTLHDLVPLYRELERMPDADATESEAQLLFQELNNLPLLADSYNTKAYWLSGGEGKFQEGITFATKGFELSRSIGNLYNQYSGLLALGIIHCELGMYSASIEYCKETLPILSKLEAGQLYEPLGWLCLLYAELNAKEEVRATRHRIWDNYDAIPEWTRIRAISHAAHASILINDIEFAETLLKRLEGLYSPDMSIFATVPISTAKTLLYLNQAKYEEVLGWLDRYLPNMRKPGTRVWGLAELYYIQGQALIAQGALEDGMQTLHKAKDFSEAIGEWRVRWRILAEMAVFETTYGSKKLGSAYREEARTSLEYVIEHIPEVELRESFLAMPEVQHLISE